MTSASAGRPWVNDYGDVPRWYWVPRHALVRHRGTYPLRSLRARAIVAAALALGYRP